MRRHRRGFVSRESRGDLAEVRDRKGPGLSWDQNSPSVKLWTRQESTSLKDGDRKEHDERKETGWHKDVRRDKRAPGERKGTERHWV